VYDWNNDAIATVVKTTTVVAKPVISKQPMLA